MSNKLQNSQAQPFDPWLLWVAFRRHWMWAIPVGLMLAAASSFLVYNSFVPEYEATHVLEANRDYVLSKDILEMRGDLARNERAIILNQLVLDPVLADPSLASVPSLSNPNTKESEIRKRIRVGNVADHLMSISYRDTDKAVVADVANKIAESYQREKRKSDGLRLKNMETWLNQPIIQASREVENAWNKYVELSKRSTGFDPARNSIEPLEGRNYIADLRDRIADIDVEVLELNAAVQGKVGENMVAAETSGNPVSESKIDVDPVQVQGYVDREPAVVQLRRKIEQNEADIRTIERKEQQGFWAGRFTKLKKEVETWRLQLVNEERLARTKAEGILKQSKIQERQARLQSLAAKREILNANYEEEKLRIGKYAGETVELMEARENYERQRLMLDKLSMRQALLVAEQGRGSSMQTFSVAKTPYAALSEPPFKKILMAGGAAFLFPFLIGLMLEFRVKRITNAEAISSNQLLPIMGEIARIPNSDKRTSGHRLFEESVDALRANLLFKLDGVRTMAVTSAMPAEGKSSVASQLAVSLARYSGEAVLVVDADLRSPDQHSLFGISMGPGLCKLFLGLAELDECIDKSLDQVHVLSAGRLSSNPYNLLTKKNLDALFEQLKTRYRYIVVDTAPVLPAAETLTVTAACEATLLCAMRDVSQSEHVMRTYRRLEDAGSNVIGTVFSGVPAREYAYRYGDYRYAQR
jgi:polysaccharide biosynthesis transport protein